MATTRLLGQSLADGETTHLSVQQINNDSDKSFAKANLLEKSFAEYCPTQQLQILRLGTFRFSQKMQINKAPSPFVKG